MAVRWCVYRKILVASDRADLTIVGTHARRGLQHVLLGSVAERVLRAAQCAVLVVQAPSG
ncbi:MAG: universal stress protein [Deltaproteobacteria bacterium]|nr:universal stress protein [Deltaproteobacteria bacterium]